MKWLEFLLPIAQLIASIIKNYFESDKKEKERKEALHAEAKEAIKSHDKSRVNAVFVRLLE